MLFRRCICRRCICACHGSSGGKKWHKMLIARGSLPPYSRSRVIALLGLSNHAAVALPKGKSIQCSRRTSGTSGRACLPARVACLTREVDDLAGRLDALPHAEVDQHPHDEQRDGELPLQAAWVVNAGAQAEHLPPATRGEGRFVLKTRSGSSQGGKRRYEYIASSLPVLDDGVDAAGRRPVGHGEASLRVPRVGARRPGQGRRERVVEEVRRPGQDHDVVHVEQEADDGRTVADACAECLAVGARAPRCANGQGGTTPISVPLNTGQMSQTVIPPWLVIWPMPTSRKKMGTPPAMRQQK